MLELYQFALCQYCEKVRLILDYKGLEYRKIEVTPGVGQWELWQMSGQKQVPVLKDGDRVIADSTAIALYLEDKYPERPIIPTDPRPRGQCLLMEEWADESMGLKIPKAFIGALNQNPHLRTSILPQQTPEPVKTLVGAVPSELLDFLGAGVGFGGDAVISAQKGLERDLEYLCLILQQRPYLLGDSPTLADLTVAALSIILKFPDGPYLDLPTEVRGKGIPGLADNSAYDTFFAWRDRLYQEYRQSLNTTDNSDSSPTSIDIE
ncbi:MAG: glutathione S-transferase family protein [Prochloron sp. SP5CPC1]|nr:glutathione S-transferase family protein [Candidatus Paraprochloron terpiosi SP5CPC1]